ncbi:MAG: protease modulator HflK [Erythrobacter sp.]|uniref:protease modulator HflK n=1 Tax=Erythrobacter sp. TaxID=1042 RepID=UPI00262864F9|nr:protease modulator HflK [Erythrobacter sp.]MDJ0979074.1 protease modulator HflK [Erythrobacter sp.]
MQNTDGLTSRLGKAFGVLTMAGKKSPWGGGSGEDGAPTGDKPDKSEGPRNPWLPGGGGGKRPSNIEDIFKNKGPEGPRRGGGPGGPNLRLPELPGGRSWAPVIIFAVLALWYAVTGVHIIEPRENAVVKRLGTYVETLQPGFHLRLPYPIETVDVEDVEGVRAVNIPGGSSEKLILTGDQNLVDLSYIVRWRIKDLPDFKFELAEPEETVNEVAEAAMRASVAEKTLDETFTGQGRAEIQQSVRERMQETLDRYQSGIQVVGVEIAKADPPGAVVEAFRDVSVAEQNADRARNQAQGYAQQTIAQAEGEAEAFDKVYEQYRLAPGVTRQRLYYETMERVLSQTDKTVVEAEGVTSYLPLPEVRRRSTPPPPPTTATTGGQ